MCAPGATRTLNPIVRTDMLYPLSYGGSERAMGIEPTVSSLARKHFTGKLRPLNVPWAGVEPASHALQARAMTT